ncbi:MAG: hypothetical protein HYX41_07235 [Bdellovibrio sp.]|nr:hypothetical protein [Bdellovibrio sp.]
MDTQAHPERADSEFQPGANVIYAMHGKCRVLQTETRSMNGETIRFYKLEISRSSFSRSNRTEPAIWVPVANARDLGMRAPMTHEEAETAMKLLLSREYFFDPHDPWSLVQPQLEHSIRVEGGLGLAKVASFLHVLKKKQIVPTPEVTKLQESTQKLLFRELSEALNVQIRTIEERVTKGFKSKLIPDN